MKFLIFLTFLLNCTTTFALNKSISIDVELAFKQMNQVRMKVIDAYREIMKMQV